MKLHCVVMLEDATIPREWNLHVWMHVWLAMIDAYLIQSIVTFILIGPRECHKTIPQIKTVLPPACFLSTNGGGGFLWRFLLYVPSSIYSIHQKKKHDSSDMQTFGDCCRSKVGATMQIPALAISGLSLVMDFPSISVITIHLLQIPHMPTIHFICPPNLLMFIAYPVVYFTLTSMLGGGNIQGS